MSSCVSQCTYYKNIHDTDPLDNQELQVRMCNNLSIPLPTDSSEEDTDSESKETEEEATMYSK